MNTDEVLKLFIKKPWWLTEGAPRTARKLKTPIKVIKEARELYYQWKNTEKAERKLMPKILIFDIETSPMKAYVWKRWKENISLDQTIDEWFCLAWSAKWLYSPEVMGDVVTPEEALAEDDKRIMRNLYELFSQADIVVAHNGDKFDIPKINSRFIVNGFPPYKPVFSVDTLRVVKKQFGFSSNKLDALAGYFGIPHKLDTDFSLWKKCLEGDEEALGYMLKYNKMDVVILEEVYLKLRPWIKGHPNMANIYKEDEINCGLCGSANVELIPGEYYYTTVGQYPVYRCKDCGGIFRGRKSITKINDVKVTNLAR